MPHIPVTTPATVRRALLGKSEIAILDVRPEGRFAEGHPLFAASFPLGQLEAQVYERLPRRSVPIVVYGDDPGDAETAVGKLRQLGYTDVSLLDGGLDAWIVAGGEVFRDVNAPSKAFGELVAVTAGTPSLPADEVAALLRDGPGSQAGGTPRAVVVDARRFDEYTTMSIPGAVSVPGAELVLRVRELAPDPATVVVVNCAGRTRSIIGTQSLINAGLPNRVAALRNGTIGWILAGLRLDHGQLRRAPEVSVAAARQAEAAAWVVADKTGVRLVSGDELRSLDDGTRTVYRFDVRTPQEYESGHLPGFRSAPGGQLVQETDWFAPVRGALVVLAGDGGGRAAMTASWLAQMGWDVVVTSAELAEPGAGPPGTAGRLERGPWAAERPRLPDVLMAGPALVADWLRAGEARVVDVDTSRRFLAAHVPGAAWALRTDMSRPELIDRLDRLDRPARPGRPGRTRRIVLASSDGYLACWAAADLQPALSEAGIDVVALAAGTEGWARSGRPLVSGPAEMLSPVADVYRRPYEGTGVDPAVMQAYLDWEYGLADQLRRDGTHGFAVLAP